MKVTRRLQYCLLEKFRVTQLVPCTEILLYLEKGIIFGALKKCLLNLLKFSQELNPNPERYLKKNVRKNLFSVKACCFE